MPAGKVVGVIAYDLSAVFDTVAADKLIPKLERIGVRGSALTWFADYLRGGSQCVVWNGEVCGYVWVAFGVRQGSILGPILFLIHVANLTEYLGTEDSSVVYADDSNAWCIANTWTEVKRGLEVISDRFACWAKGNGLVLNASKTQVLVCAGAGKDLVVNVNGKEIRAAETLELLGVRFDRRFATMPHLLHLAKATTQRAAMITRLACHLPRGEYLRQLAQGLVFGKIGHALAVTATPRLTQRPRRRVA
jgi:hypothetical protein